MDAENRNKGEDSYSAREGNKSYQAHTTPKYLENIVEIFLGNIVRLPKDFETYHKYY